MISIRKAANEIAFKNQQIEDESKIRNYNDLLEYFKKYPREEEKYNQLLYDIESGRIARHPWIDIMNGYDYNRDEWL